MNLPLDDACRYIDTGRHGDYRYKLLRPFRFKHKFAFEFRNEWLSIDFNAVEIAKGYACDGVTWAPDLRFVMPGVFIHDVMYQFAEAIAAAIHKTVKAVLEIADKVFRTAMLANILARTVLGYCARRSVVYTYYGAVRTFGYAYHRAARKVREASGSGFAP